MSLLKPHFKPQSRFLLALHTPTARGQRRRLGHSASPRGSAPPAATPPQHLPSRDPQHLTPHPAGMPSLRLQSHGCHPHPQDAGQGLPTRLPLLLFPRILPRNSPRTMQQGGSFSQGVREPLLGDPGEAVLVCLTLHRASLFRFQRRNLLPPPPVPPGAPLGSSCLECRWLLVTISDKPVLAPPSKVSPPCCLLSPRHRHRIFFIFIAPFYLQRSSIILLLLGLFP